MLENGGQPDWAEELFPSAGEARLGRALPVGSGRREFAKRKAAGLLDWALGVRGTVRSEDAQLDRAEATVPVRDVLVAGVYGDDPDAMVAAAEQMRDSRHDVRLALGSRGDADPRLAEETVGEGLSGGKFANLNAVFEAGERPRDWALILDDDVELPPRFLDRMIGAAEAIGLDLAQPAQTWSSDPPWQVTRRRPAFARRTRFVEIGPVVLLRRTALDALTPFCQEGMGWGLCLHWAALAEREGWRLGVVDALPVSHTRRETASGYSADQALAAARDFLAANDHVDRCTAEQVLETYHRLPEPAIAAAAQ